MRAVSAAAEERFVLTVDLGTGGPKVGLVSLGGTIAFAEHTPVAVHVGPGGAATQDAGAWWSAVVGSVRRALASGIVAPEQVDAVCCTGQWGSIVPVDATGVPVAEAILWLDRRGVEHARRVVGGPVQGYHPYWLARWVRTTGGVPSPQGADPLSHLLHLVHDEPDVVARARWLLEPVDYLGMRFSGRAAATRASLTGWWLTDNRPGAPLGHDPVLLARTGLDALAGKLAPLVEPLTVLGPLRPAVADELGLPRSVAVVVGAPDLHTAPFAAGAVEDFDTHLAIGSTGWISCHVPFKKTDVLRQIASVPSAVPGRWLVADNQETAGLCMVWLRRVLTDGTDGLTPDGPLPPYPAVHDVAATVPAGSGGVLFAPWLLGERSPVDDRTLRASFHNLSLDTTRAHLVRAVLEGVAFNARWLLGAVERFVGRPVPKVRMIGGGSSSELWCRIHAGVLGRPVEQVADPLESGLRGAAMLAGVARGRLSLAQVAERVPVRATFEPDPADVAVYEELFGAFRSLYRRQRTLYRGLQRRRSSAVAAPLPVPATPPA